MQNKRFIRKKGVFRFKFGGKTPNHQVQTDKTGRRFIAAIRGSTMGKIGSCPPVERTDRVNCEINFCPKSIIARSRPTNL